MVILLHLLEEGAQYVVRDNAGVVEAEGRVHEEPEDDVPAPHVAAVQEEHAIHGVQLRDHGAVAGDDDDADDEDEQLDAAGLQAERAGDARGARDLVLAGRRQERSVHGGDAARALDVLVDPEARHVAVVLGRVRVVVAARGHRLAELRDHAVLAVVDGLEELADGRSVEHGPAVEEGRARDALDVGRELVAAHHALAAALGGSDGHQRNALDDRDDRRGDVGWLLQELVAHAVHGVVPLLARLAARERALRGVVRELERRRGRDREAPGQGAGDVAHLVLPVVRRIALDALLDRVQRCSSSEGNSPLGEDVQRLREGHRDPGSSKSCGIRVQRVDLDHHHHAVAVSRAARLALSKRRRRELLHLRRPRRGASSSRRRSMGPAARRGAGTRPDQHRSRRAIQDCGFLSSTRLLAHHARHPILHELHVPRRLLREARGERARRIRRPRRKLDERVRRGPRRGRPRARGAALQREPAPPARARVAGRLRVGGARRAVVQRHPRGVAPRRGRRPARRVQREPVPAVAGRLPALRLAPVDLRVRRLRPGRPLARRRLLAAQRRRRPHGAAPAAWRPLWRKRRACCPAAPEDELFAPGGLGAYETGPAATGA